MVKEKAVKIPTQITYRHLAPSEALTSLINQQVAKLEEFETPIIDCRVVVDQSTQHHREKHFHVEVVVDVAGAELVAGRAPDDVRGKDPYAVVHDAFRAVRSQLQEHAQRRRREVKGSGASIRH
jgi:ribosomal subunit interface protein